MRMFYTECMKKYKFRFSTLILCIFALGLALCAAGLGLNIYRLLTQGAQSPYEWMQYIILFFVSILLAVIIVSMFIKSQYVITERKLIVQFGIIRTKYDITKISSVHLFQGAGKLAVYFSDNKYTAVVIKECYFDDFIKELTSKNEKIGFSFSTAEEEDELKKKK